MPYGSERIRQEARLWAFTLHEDDVFNSRQNLFLVAESMLVVAYATALGAHGGASALAITVIALLLTTAWLYASVRHTLIIDHIQRHAKSIFPEYKRLYQARHWRFLPMRSRTVAAVIVPTLVGGLWITFLVIQL